MNKEDIELLLKDLSDRVPYGPDISINDKKGFLLGVDCNILLGYEPTVIVGFDGDAKGVYTSITDVKPYLRPMNSITDEELEELHNLVCPNNVDSSFDVNGYFTSKTDCNGHLMPYSFMVTVMDFLLRHNFDFRGLIEKGLALEETIIKDKDNGIVQEV